MRICSGAGCLRAVPDDVRFCDECAVEHAHDKLSGFERGQTDAILREYSKPRWNKGIRPRVLQRFPLCAKCGIEPSTIADHNIPARIIVAECRRLKLFRFESLPGFYIMENLRGLCHGCHNAKTKIEDSLNWSDELERVLAKYLKQKTYQANGKRRWGG